MAKSKLFKMISIALISTFAVTAISGCSGDGSSSTGSSSTDKESSSAQSSKEDDKKEEPMEMIFPVHWLEKMTDTQPMRAELETKFNIKIINEQIPTDKEATTLRIASGDIPEILWDVTMQDYHNYADQGVISEIPIDMIKENAPLLFEWANKNTNNYAWKYNDHNGKNYSLMGAWTLATDGLVLGYRGDILKEVGIDKVPQTIDEMETAMRTVKEKKNIVPYTTESFEQLGAIYGAYGEYLCYYDKDGKIVFGGIEDGSKEAVTTLSKWYKEGLLDPEFMINKFDNVKEKWSKDQALVTQFYWWEFLPKEAFFDGRLYEPSKDKQGFENIIADPPKGPNGDFGTTQGNPVGNAGLCFGVQLEKQPEKLKKYLEIYNHSFIRETMDYLSYGIEGETYNYNNETGVEWIAPYDDPAKRDEYGIALYPLPGCFNDYDLQAKYMTQPRYLEKRNEAQSHGIGKYDLLTPFYRPIYNDKFEVINKIYKNAHIDFITGARPISEWDNFVKEWLDAGGQAVLDEGQAILDGMK